jgi:hypothetical protein
MARFPGEEGAMNLDARKFGAATAVVAAIFWTVSRLLLLAAPFGPIRGAGYAARGSMMHGHMMRGYAAGGYRYGPMHGLGWGAYLAAFIVGLIVFPLIAGVGGWATAAIYNRLLARSEKQGPSTRSSD